MPFFKDLDSKSHEKIAKLLKPRLALPHEPIFELGGPPESMYFISSGSARVSLKDREVILGSGDFFGEMALLNDQPRIASVYSLGFSELLTLESRDFHELLDQEPNLKKVIEQVGAERMSEW